jgi:hypothetical protein
LISAGMKFRINRSSGMVCGPISNTDYSKTFTLHFSTSSGWRQVVGGALRARLEHSSLNISAMKSKRVDKTLRALGINEDSIHFCRKA